MDNNFGKPSVAMDEETFMIAHDIVGYAPATALTDKTVMPRTVKSKEFQSHNFADMADYENSIIQGISVRPMMAFATRNTSEPAGITLMHFYNHSAIEITRNSKVYDRIYLCDLIPFYLVWQVTDVAILAKQNAVFSLGQPLEIPNGQFEIVFKPAHGLTTAADATTNPALVSHPDANSSNHVYYLDFYFYGKKYRGVA